MHHILNVKHIFIEEIFFLDWNYYHFKSLRRAGSMVSELKYGLFIVHSGKHGGTFFHKNA